MCLFCSAQAYLLSSTLPLPEKFASSTAMSKAVLEQIESAVKTKGAELVKQAGAVFQLVVGDKLDSQGINRAHINPDKQDPIKISSEALIRSFQGSASASTLG